MRSVHFQQVFGVISGTILYLGDAINCDHYYSEILQIKSPMVLVQSGLNSEQVPQLNETNLH